MFSIKMSVAARGSVALFTVRNESYQFYLMSLSNNDNNMVPFMLRCESSQKMLNASDGCIELSADHESPYGGKVRVWAAMYDENTLEVFFDAADYSTECFPMIRLM